MFPPQPKTRVLAVAEEAMQRILASQLQEGNFDVKAAAKDEDALRLLRTWNPSVVLVNVNADGLRVLELIRQSQPEIPVIAISAGAAPEEIFQASKLGANDWLTVPCDGGALALRIARLAEKGGNGEEPQLRDRVRKQRDFTMLYGTSPKMEDVKDTIEQVAGTNVTVLIRGESGTGKEVVARMIHAKSPRKQNPFVKVNCAAIPNELLESELFGYEQGAFTGATRQKPGKFDQANNGTIFLDEISEMHPSLQAKLLHVLQDGEFARLGSKHDVTSDVRVLAATNKPLESAVAEGQFREDLFYRLNVVSIHIPPLRERRQEIPVFLDFFLSRYSEYYGKQRGAFSAYAVSRMMEYNWPGNIRELENLVKRFVIVGNEAQIIRELSTPKPLMRSVAWNSATEPLEENSAQATEELERRETESLSLLEIGRRAAMKAEREAIERVLTQTRWNRREAAKILKVSYKALLNKLKLMEIEDGKEQKKGASES